MAELSRLPLLAILIVVFGLLMFLIAMRLANSARLTRRLQDYVIEPIQTKIDWDEETSYYRPEISGSFVYRTIGAGMRILGNLLGGFLPGGAIAELDRKLTIAGNPLGLHGREFYGIRIMFLFLGAFLAFAIVQRFTGIKFFIFAVVTLVVVFYLPTMWLRSIVKSKKARNRKDLPDALDMLSVCADAGLGFDQSLQRISEDWDTPLAVEFGRVVTEMSVGETRASAMRNMGERIDVTEVSSFIAVILQSYELGMGIAETLHAQANQMRIERRFWAQEQARKIPIKMLFPLMFLIFPAMFAVILGPAIPHLRDLFSKGVFGR